MPGLAELLTPPPPSSTASPEQEPRPRGPLSSSFAGDPPPPVPSHHIAPLLPGLRWRFHRAPHTSLVTPDPLPKQILAGIVVSVITRAPPPPEMKRTMPSVHLRESYGYREDRLRVPDPFRPFPSPSAVPFAGERRRSSASLCPLSPSSILNQADPTRQRLRSAHAKG